MYHVINMKEKNIKYFSMLLTSTIHYIGFWIIGGFQFSLIMDSTLDGKQLGLFGKVISIFVAIWELPFSLITIPYFLINGFYEAFDLLFLIGVSAVASLFWGWLIVFIVLKDTTK